MPCPSAPACRAVLALLLAGVLVPALGAGPPPVAVETRTLKQRPLPDDAGVSGNVPEDGAIVMPLVTGGAPGVAGRINAAVWGEMLEGVPVPTTPGATFTPPPGGEIQGTSQLAFQAVLVPAAAPRLLALSLSGESCGAYCEDFVQTRVFDLRDGRRVALPDLLTTRGLAEVGRRLDGARRAAYHHQISLLERERRRGGPGPDDDTDDRLALDADCLAQVASDPSTPERLAEDEFALDARGGLSVTHERCSNHASRALDDVGAVTIALPPADLRRLATPYGRAVLPPDAHAP